MVKRENETELTFEEALAKLEALVHSIEQGKIGLQESIQQYEEGMKLIKRCRSILAEAEQRIQKLQLSAEGELTPGPFAPEASTESEASSP